MLPAYNPGMEDVLRALQKTTAILGMTGGLAFGRKFVARLNQEAYLK